MNEELLAFGEKLRATREALGFTLPDVEKATRIRAKFLQAFEQGELDPSLSESQIRGFLRNYARALRLDPDQVIAAFEQAKLGGKRRWFLKPKTEIPTTNTPSVPQKPVIAPAIQTQAPEVEPFWRQAIRMVLYSVAAVGFMGLMGAGTILILNQVAGKPPSSNDANPPLVVDVPTQVDTLTPTITPSPTIGGVVLTPPVMLTDGVSMMVNAKARSWIEVKVDGVSQYRGILKPGLGVQFQGQESIEIVTGNAGGLELLVNGRNVGEIGVLGAFYRNVFTRAGLSTPTLPAATPTLTPTATITVPFAASTTPTPTNTATLGTETGAALVTLAANPLPTASSLLGSESAPLIITEAPSPIPLPPTLELPSATPTITPTPTVTLTPTVYLPERITRTPRP